MKLEKIEGIGAVYAKKMAVVGVTTTAGLLKAAADRKGRKDLSGRSGVSEKMILEWVNKADLMRVKGVGEEYSDLLEAAGVDTVRELRNRNAGNLHTALTETNIKKNLVRRPPSLGEVSAWVENAKALEPLVTY